MKERLQIIYNGLVLFDHDKADASRIENGDMVRLKYSVNEKAEYLVKLSFKHKDTRVLKVVDLPEEMKGVKAKKARMVLIVDMNAYNHQKRYGKE